MPARNLRSLPPAAVPPLRRQLLAWYRRCARDLPWRRTRDPYAIWISEVMLQQTTVEAARPYYLRFLRRFPDLPSFARASESDVLALWSGLGYYQRARNLRSAARVVVEKHGGHFPSDLGTMLELPGIGPYTAGAIGSIAFGLKAAAIDTNAFRVLSRLLGDLPAGRPGRSAGAGRASAALRDFADSLVPSRQPGTWNQAVMELGSRICRPSLPDCPACPVSHWCRAFATGKPERFTTSPRRTATIAVRAGLLVLERADGRVLLVRRPDGEILAGLWELPGTLHHALRTTPAARRSYLPREAWTVAEPAAATVQNASAGGDAKRIGHGTNQRGNEEQQVDADRMTGLVRALGLGRVRMEWRGVVHHAVTHRRLTIDAWHGSPASPRPARFRTNEGENHLWADPRRLEALPIGSASRKVLTQVLRGRPATTEPISS